MIRPQQEYLRRQRNDLRPQQEHLRPEQDDFRPEQEDFRPEQNDFRPKQEYSRPKQDYFRRHSDNRDPHPAMKIVLLAVGFILAAGRPAPHAEADTTRSVILLDDFELDQPGELPQKWRYLSTRQRDFIPVEPSLSEREKVIVMRENGNNFLRVRTEAEALRISLPIESVGWRLSESPILSWRWRALELPSGAREDRVNDSGGAIYVTFAKRDWLGRPLSIKYVYSSTLPVGTEVSTGNVKILVASSGTDGIGSWVRVSRNVVKDYRRLFGDEPPDEPFAVTIWSDSDNTRSVGEVDFDDLKISSGR